MAHPLFDLPQGRRVVITGGAGGIGRALVLALIAHGSHVTVIDLPQAIARHPVPEGVVAITCDLADPKATARAFAAIGDRHDALDALVALAGFARGKTPVSDIADGDWREVSTGNLDASFHAIRAALPLLRRGDDPTIVTMASGLAFKATAGYGPYAVAKAGIIALTKLVAGEEAPLIRVNTVAPSAVDTEFLRGGTGHSTADEPMRLDVERYLAGVPLKRLATPDDIVGPILFLLSPAAHYITGQTIHINGGSFMP